jgi:hypothetical protein
MPKQPDATLKFADAEAKLFLHAVRLKDGSVDVDGDQVIVQPFNGKEENAIVYRRFGEIKAGRIRQPILQPTGSPATLPDFSEAIEPLAPEDEKRLLGIYDRLLSDVAA